jgi:transcription elongation factor Elf1
MPDVFEKVRFDPDSLTEEEKARYDDETRTTKKEYYTELLGKDAPIKLTLLEISDLIDSGVDPKLLQSQLRFRSDLDVTKMNIIQKFKILKNLYPYFGDRILKMLFTPQELKTNKLLLRVYLDRDIEDKSRKVVDQFSVINDRFINWATKAVSNIDDIAFKCPSCKTITFSVMTVNNDNSINRACTNCGMDLIQSTSNYTSEINFNSLSLEEYMNLFNEIYYLNKFNDLKNLSLIIHKCFDKFRLLVSNFVINNVISENEINYMLNNSEFVKNMTDAGFGHIFPLTKDDVKPKAAFNYKKYKLVLGK